MSEIYNIEAKLSNGETIKLEQYKGKVLLVVNVASRCGFTPQYDGLQNLYEKYKDQGLEVLAFPCNQFGKQEPGSDQEIQDFCTMNFSVKFPLFQKIEVNGANAHPLYDQLKSSLPGIMGTKAIKWNFTKFLVDKAGNPVSRHASNAKPESLEDEIKKLLE